MTSRVPTRFVAVLVVALVIGQVVVGGLRVLDEDAAAGAPLATGGGLVVSDVLLSEGRVRRAAMTSDLARPPVHVLYGELGREDPLAGRTLVVGTAFDSVDVLPTVKTAGFRVVDLSGRQGAVGRDRAWTWVTWDLPDCTDACQGYVAGRNVAEAEVLVAARSVASDRASAAVPPSALPPGLVPLVTAALGLPEFTLRKAQVVSWTWDKAEVKLTVSDDQRLALLLRFWVDDSPRPVRGGAGSAGSLAAIDGGPSTEARAWGEGGRALLVTSAGLSDRQLDRFVTALRSAREGEWETLRNRVLDVSSSAVVERCSLPGRLVVAVGRREDKYQWGVAFSVGGRQNDFSHCNVILTAGEGGSLTAGGGPRPAPGRISVSTFGQGGDPSGLFVVGIAPPRTDRVDAVLPDGRVVDAVLADEGPEPDQRYYAVFFEGEARPKPTLVALDGAGTELARVRVGAPQ